MTASRTHRLLVVGSVLTSVGASLALAQPTILATPTSGRLGTVISLEVSPHTPGYELTSETSASWTGVYQPPMGPASSGFSVAYPVNQVTVTGDWTAQIILGQGSFTNPPNPASLEGFGTLEGTISLTTPASCPEDLNGDGSIDVFDFGLFALSFGQAVPPGTGADLDGNGVVNVFDFGLFVLAFGTNPCPPSPFVTISSSLSFGVQTDAAAWHLIHYPAGPGGLDPPEIGPELDSIVIYRLSLLPNPTTPTVVQLNAATDMHGAVVVRLEQNAATEAEAPATVSANVISYDGAGSEVDRINGLVLSQLANDGDPNNITYVSDLAKPIIVVDTPLDQAAYPNFVFLLGTVDGSVGIAPD